MKLALKYPDHRSGLISCIMALSKQEFQESNWEKGPGKDMFRTHFLMEYDYLVNDLNLGLEEDEKEIGLIFYNREEYLSVKKLVQVLDDLFDRLGTEKLDFVYMNSPFRNDVIKAAKEAYELLIKNGD